MASPKNSIISLSDLRMLFVWISLCLLSLCSASSEDDGLVIFGELFASWSALVMLVLLIVALNYFERVRQPPVPILEKYTKNIAIPPHVVAKFEEITQKGKVAVYTWAIELPYVGKLIKGSGEMKPLMHDTRVGRKISASDDVQGISQPRDDDYRDMIIGAPLDEDNVSSPRTSPKSPPLVVVKTMIDDQDRK